MALKYLSGEEIRKGDRVLFHREPYEVDLVVTELGDPETDCYMEDDGGGVGIFQPTSLDRVFIPADQIDDTEDLEFVSRAEEQ